jgi:hypothetical protein
MRASPGGDARSRELRPNSIRSDTSRHDIVAPPVGGPESLVDTAVAAEATPTLPTPTLPPHVPSSSRKDSGSRAPVRPVFTGRSPFSAILPRPAFRPLTGWTTCSGKPGRTLERPTHADHPAPPGTAERLDRSRDPTALDRGSLHLLLREEPQDQPHPRCLPSTRHLRSRRRAHARRCAAGGAFSTGCHQPVDRARRLFSPSLDRRRLTYRRLRRRGLCSARAGRNPARAHRGRGVCPFLHAGVCVQLG